MKNHGNTWTTEEEEKFYNRVSKGISFEEIAQKHQRGIGAIKARARRLNLLCKEGKLLSPLPIYIPYAKLPYIKKSPIKKEILSQVTSESNIEVLREEDCISVRLYNCLKNMEIANIEDTLHLTPKEVLKQPNCGRSTLMELERIQKHLIPLTLPKEDNKEEVNNIIDASSLIKFKEDFDSFYNLIKECGANDIDAYKNIRNSLSHLKNHIRFFDKALLSYNFAIDINGNTEREIYQASGITAQRILALIEEMMSLCVKDERISYILKGRIGILEHSAQMTLQELGDKFDITRERIRQLETKGIRILINHSKKSDNSYNKELRNICEDLFVNKEDDLLSSMIAYCYKFYGDLVNKDIICSILCSSLGVFTNHRTAVSQIKIQNKKFQRKVSEETKKLLKDEKYLNLWTSIFSQGSFPKNRIKFDGYIPQMTGRYREINRNSTGRTGSYYSKKCQREICYESGEEHRLYQIMEKTDKVVWYQEQPISIPYKIDNRQCQYRPDLAVITDDGYGTVIEVKPPLNLVQLPTLRKAIEATKYLHNKGIGFILVDSHGRSLKNLSTYPTYNEIAERILGIIREKGEVDYSTYKELTKDTKIRTPEFISTMVHYNLTFMSRPFRIWRLPNELSYDFLLM